jgi:predicted dienelactone hydrolase
MLAQRRSLTTIPSPNYRLDSGERRSLPVSRRISAWVPLLLSTGIGIVSTLITTTPVRAAEQVELTVPPLAKIVVPVNDLESFAKTGKVSDKFSFYTKFAPKQQLDALQEVLQRRYTVSPTTVSQFTSTRIGTSILEQLSQMLKAKSKSDHVGAIRSALLKAAADPEGLSIITILRNYPDQSVQVDVKQSFNVVRELTQLFEQQDQVIATIQNQAAQQGSPSGNSMPADLRQPGGGTYQQQTLMVENPKRGGSFPVNVYLPRTQMPAPLIVISHGLASDSHTFAYLAEHLASYGFAVAALEHPGTSARSIERFFAGLDQIREGDDWVNRPLDVKYLLDTLQQKVESDPVWRGTINVQQVGVLGQSLGGYTALAVGGASLNIGNLRQVCPLPSSNKVVFNLALLFQCGALSLPNRSYILRDDRVKAILPINSIGGTILGKQGFSQLRIPVLMVAGGDDVIAPSPAEQIYPFTWITTPEKYLVVIDKGTHFSFLGRTNNDLVPVPQELIGPDPERAKPVLKALSTAFFNLYLNNQPQYRSYLTNAYVNTIAQSPFNLSLVTSLTAAQLEQPVARVPQPSRPVSMPTQRPASPPEPANLPAQRPTPPPEPAPPTRAW